MEGWIKLYRQLVNWEWYQDANTFRVFIHLVLIANHEDAKWQGRTILRGQVLTSYDHLAQALKLTVQNVRTSIKKLEKTGEITIKSTNKFSLITIEKYSNFQSSNFEINKQNNKQLTNNQQTTNKQLTTNKNEKNDKNDKNNLNNNNSTIDDYSEKFERVNQLLSKYRKEGN